MAGLAPRSAIRIGVLADLQTDRVTAYERRVVAVLMAERPDLILMDIQLPGVSGLVVAKSIKDDERLKNIPIIAVTAFAMKGDEDRMREAGCEAYLAKPVSTPNFLKTVEQFLT